MIRFLKLLASVAVCQATGLLSTPFTISAIPTWYAFLNKPFFAPPNWIFAPAWTILYTLMGISLYIIWSKGIKKRKVKQALGFFFVQLGLNFLWSYVFFGLKSPELALLNIAAMWVFILMTLVKFRPISKLAFYLLIPYFLWVSFASLLNASIAILN